MSWPAIVAGAFPALTGTGPPAQCRPMMFPSAPRAELAWRPPLFFLTALTALWPVAAHAQTQAGLYWAATLHGWLAAMLALMATVVGLVSGLHHRERPASFLVGMMLSWVVLRATAARPVLPA